MTRADIFAEIEAERVHQDQRWGHEADDTKNAPNDWVAFMAHYSTIWFGGQFAPYKPDVGAAFRASMVKVAATAVAAIESYDRQVVAKGKPFYVED